MHMRSMFFRSLGVLKQGNETSDVVESDVYISVALLHTPFYQGI